MDDLTQKAGLDIGAGLLLTVLCMLWGLNAVAIKVSNLGIAPICGAGIRSVLASVCLIVWMRFKKIPLFEGRLMDGVVVGLLFGIEFGLLYSSLQYTSTSSAWILLYTSPFFHALGAHFFLKGDRLKVVKCVGLILAFSGIVILLSKYKEAPSSIEFLGDLLAMGAAFLWALTTIYIKRRLVGKVSPHHTLFYQTIFSIPLLFLLSGLFGERPVHHLDALILLSMAYQGVVIAFLSYLLWFFLVHVYPVSRLSAFTFLTPIFATVCGVIFLHEPLGPRLILSLVLVSVGIYVVNIDGLAKRSQ